MKRFAVASAWLAAFLLVIPTAGLAVAASSLHEPAAFLGWYLVLLALAYILGLIPLALIGLAPDWLRALVTAMVMYVIALVTPLTTAMASFPIHVIRCGGLPLVATDFAAAKSYTMPSSEYYLVTPLDSRFFCTEDEARAARYHRWPVP
ncbi:hypothetical protein [Nonomuraea ferruginea]|uniref:Uncharacterized protein n=1 Tax=Nonomuraea ferruginea TaxID=46174 RepID=A0ABT4SV62_9ACTN|nr:hypothetical protein [Nonomuraea ferruginea]MDA0641154.1 hypothetical protein [Nonomuraea ferruginea]